MTLLPGTILEPPDNADLLGSENIARVTRKSRATVSYTRGGTAYVDTISAGSAGTSMDLIHNEYIGYITCVNGAPATYAVCLFSAWATINTANDVVGIDIINSQGVRKYDYGLVGAGGGGGSGTAIFVWVLKTANFTVTAADLTAGHGFLISAASGSVTATLLSAAGVTQPIIFKRTDTTYANAVTLQPSGVETIEGAVSAVLVVKGHTYELGSDNINWWIKSGFFPNPMIAKGDVVAGDANAIPTRVAVGANAQRLTSRSTAVTGVDYEA